MHFCMVEYFPIMFQNFIIDFDSTFVSVESLDELAKIALQNNPDRNRILQQIELITKKGMDGTLSFDVSLEARLKMFKPTIEDIKQLVSLLKNSITSSFMKNKNFIRKYRDKIYIISGGFKDYIVPIVSDFGIAEDHVLANTFIVKNNSVTDFDKKNYLVQSKGKVKAVKSLKLSGKIVVIGDGYTDYEIKKEKAADQFVAFIENIRREKVVRLADKVINRFDEFIAWTKG